MVRTRMSAFVASSREAAPPSTNASELLSHGFAKPPFTSADAQERIAEHRNAPRHGAVGERQRGLANLRRAGEVEVEVGRTAKGARSDRASVGISSGDEEQKGRAARQ